MFGPSPKCWTRAGQPSLIIWTWVLVRKVGRAGLVNLGWPPQNADVE